MRAAVWTLLLVPPLLLTSGCDSDSQESASNASSSTQSLPTTSGSASENVAITKCADLLAEQWKPPRETPDISFDPETDEATVSYSSEVLKLALGEDSECFRLPEIGGRLSQLYSQFGN